MEYIFKNVTETGSMEKFRIDMLYRLYNLNGKIKRVKQDVLQKIYLQKANSL